MAYRLTLHEGLAEGLGRVALEQLDRARTVLVDEGLTPVEQVHEARKALKRFRAVVRMLRPTADEVARSLNEAARDLARYLSPFRDQDVLSATFVDLTDGEAAFTPLGGLLSKERAKYVGADGHGDAAHATFAGPDGAREAVLGGLAALLTRVLTTSFALPPKAVAKGMATAHRRMRRAMRHAAATRTPDDLHEWRKRAKHYGYVARLFGKVWGAVGGASIKEIEALGDLLGEVRDLTLLDDHLATLSSTTGQPRLLEALRALVRERQAALIERAFQVGDGVTAKAPHQVKRRVAASWPADRRRASAVPDADEVAAPASPPKAGQGKRRRPARAPLAEPRALAEPT